MILKFDRDKDERWFVDLPSYIESGGDREDLEMVMGADLMLDRFLRDGENSVSLDVSTDMIEYHNTLEKMPIETNSGAYYLWSSGTRPRVIIWLCDVVKFLFPDFPETIYFQIL